MAKKDPKDFTVEDKLFNLYQLQTILSSIDEKRALRGELPLEVQDLEDEIEGLHTRIEKIASEIKEFKAAVQQKQGEIVDAQTRLARYQEQLNDVKNNREYDTLSKEIQFLSLEIELCNKKIKEGSAQVEAKEAQLEQNQTNLNEREKDLVDKKKELNTILSETREEEEQLKAQAADLEEKIEPRLLTSFKRILRNARNGLGIVYVQRDSCGGCFNKIPPQRQLDIKMHKKIIVCEYCGRILIDPELAGVQTAAPEADKTVKRKRAVRKKKAETEE